MSVGLFVSFVFEPCGGYSRTDDFIRSHFEQEPGAGVEGGACGVDIIAQKQGLTGDIGVFRENEKRSLGVLLTLGGGEPVLDRPCAPFAEKL